jgi:hypothetical protein
MIENGRFALAGYLVIIIGEILGQRDLFSRLNKNIKPKHIVIEL